MIRKKKRYSKPRKLYESGRIKEENILVKKYGLKNKREIWKTLAKVNYFRSRAKSLAKASQEEQTVLFNKLKSIGIKAETISDILDLKVEDFLERRLSTVIMKKKLASTSLGSRQLVVHKKILINGKVMDAPSYLVPVKDESTIQIKNKNKKQVVSSKANEEIKEEILEVQEEKNGI